MSAIPPDQYANRFVKFIRRNVNTREDVVNTTREDLSNIITIREKSPITTSSAASREKSSSTDDVDLVKTGGDRPNNPEQKLPEIRVQRTSPELKEGGFESEILSGLSVNGCRDN